MQITTVLEIDHGGGQKIRGSKRKSWRNTGEGSIFMKQVCKTFGQKISQREGLQSTRASTVKTEIGQGSTIYYILTFPSRGVLKLLTLNGPL